MALLLLSFSDHFRRLAWEVFYRLHVVVIIAVVIMITIHGGFYSWCGIGLWVFDVFFRYAYLATVKNSKTATVVTLTSDVTKVVIETGDFSFRAGQVSLSQIWSLLTS
jgi:hypothetical protein